MAIYGNNENGKRKVNFLVKPSKHYSTEQQISLIIRTLLSLKIGEKEGAQKRTKMTQDHGANIITETSFKRLQAVHSKSAMR